MLKFDPRLCLDAETAGQFESTMLPLFESPTVLINDAYSFALAAENAGESVWVRAATGEEMTAYLTVGAPPNPNDYRWPGDPALSTGGKVDWQETEGGDVLTDNACYLWNGEVILVSGRGASSPFFVHEAAARAWALSTALSLPASDVLGLQIVPYVCARQFAPGLLEGGEQEFKRLNKFWVSPLKSWGYVKGCSLPGVQNEVRDVPFE